MMRLCKLSQKSKQVMTMLLLCFFVISMSASFTGIVHAAKEEENNMSFYAVSTALREYFNNATRPQKSGKTVDGLTVAADNKLNIGDAGAFVAYGEQDWISSARSNSSSSASYESLMNVPTNASGGDPTKALISYARYGYLLGALGLDKSASSGALPTNAIVGGAVLGLYRLAIAVPQFFSAIITILKTLNPFTLFGLAESTSAGGNSMDSIGADDARYGLSSAISAWYDTLYSFSWAVIVPIFFAVLVASMLLFRTANKLTKLKKYCIRIAFIVVGIPLLGSLYTGMLNGVGELISVENTVVTRVVASTFLDFETWASNSRLTPPPGATLSYTTADSAGVDTDTGSGARPTAEALVKLRETAYNINRASGSIPDLPADGSPFATSVSAADGIVWDTTTTDTDVNTTDAKAVRDVVNMLERYSKGDFYYGSDYETKIKAELTAVAALKAEDSAAIYKMFDEATKADKWSGDYLKTAFTDKGFANWHNIFANGNLNDTDTTGVFTTPGAFSNKLKVESGKQSGLSTMSMYNYLNTSFNESNMVVYSSEKAASGFVRQDHRAVTLVGTGWIAFLYWINCVLLLGSSVVLGYFYGFAILFANLKRGIHLITAVPFAILGSMRAIAMVIIYTLMLIIEVVVTIFVYGLILEILMQIPLIFQTPLAAGLNASAVMSDVASGNVATVLLPVILVFSCIVYIVFIYQSIRLRKVVVKGVDEAAAEIINKFLDVNGTPPPQTPSLLQKAGGAVAAGAGMAASQKLMGGNGKDNEKKSRGTNGTSGTTGTAATGDGDGDGEDGDTAVAVKEGAGGKDVKATATKSGGASKLLNNKKLLTGSVDAGGLSPGDRGDNDDPSNVCDTDYYDDYEDYDGDYAGFDNSNDEQADKKLADEVSEASSIGAVPVVSAVDVPKDSVPNNKGVKTPVSKNGPQKGVASAKKNALNNNTRQNDGPTPDVLLVNRDIPKQNSNTRSKISNTVQNSSSVKGVPSINPDTPNNSESNNIGRTNNIASNDNDQSSVPRNNVLGHGDNGVQNNVLNTNPRIPTNNTFNNSNDMQNIAPNTVKPNNRNVMRNNNATLNGAPNNNAPLNNGTVNKSNVPNNVPNSNAPNTINGTQNNNAPVNKGTTTNNGMQNNVPNSNTPNINNGTQNGNAPLNNGMANNNGVQNNVPNNNPRISNNIASNNNNQSSVPRNNAPNNNNRIQNDNSILAKSTTNHTTRRTVIEKDSFGQRDEAVLPKNVPDIVNQRSSNQRSSFGDKFGKKDKLVNPQTTKTTNMKK